MRIARGDQPILRQQRERKRAADLRDATRPARPRPCARASARTGAARPRCRCWSGRSIRRGPADRAARWRSPDCRCGRWRSGRARSRSGSAARSAAGSRPRSSSGCGRWRCGRAGTRAPRSSNASATCPIAREMRIFSPSAVADAGALLPAMLQRVEAEVGQVGRFGMAEDAEDAALVFEFIEHGSSVPIMRPPS